MTIQLQRVTLPNSSRPTWTVIGDDYLPIQPIQDYLRYLHNLERSPNTIATYARALKFYWEFLQAKHIDWLEVNLENLADFIHWLRCPEPGVIPIQPQTARRTEKTINLMLTAVCGFYEFHERMGVAEGVDAYHYQFQPGRRYKPFLHHITKGKEVRTRLLKLKEPRTLPGLLTPEQVQQLINACKRVRDKFLLCLLHQTGMRIGEVLGLRHEDIRSTGENEIHVVPRLDNFNGARVKSASERVIHVSKTLMGVYADYLIEEYPEEVDSDYVFVNIWEGERGSPMTYAAVDSLFKRLRKKTEIEVHPHLFRHTHATELIRSGWDMAHVQKRLGHASVQTTIDTYTHLDDEDLKAAYQDYMEKVEQ